jgi:hypothetical protein
MLKLANWQKHSLGFVGAAILCAAHNIAKGKKYRKSA